MKKEQVDQFLKLDQEVYNSSHQVDKNITLERLRRNPYTDLVIMDREKLVGYISLCPITPELFQSIIHTKPTEEEIEKEVISYLKPGYYQTYLSSCVIDKENYPFMTAAHLFEALEQHIIRLRKRGIFIQKMIAFTVSIPGRKTVERMGFKKVKENVFIYSCLKQGITFIKKKVKDYRSVFLQIYSITPRVWGDV